MPIKPLYVSKKANASIALGSAPVEVTAGSTTVRGQGHAYLRLVPRDSVIVETLLPSDAAPRLFLTDGNTAVRYGANGKPVPAIAINSNCSNKGLRADYRPSSGGIALCADRRVRLQQAVFHVLNFPDFFSTDENAQDLHYRNGRGSHTLGRAVLSQADWTIEIEALPGTADLVKQLKAEGGHAITHVGCLKRRDGRTFTIAAAERVIYDLHRFLSFARGQWTAIFGLCGYNRRDAVVYEGWQERLSSPWGGTFRWFDPHHGETLAQAYNGFAQLLHDPRLGEAASTSLYWYLRANRAGEGAGIDGGVILAQAALERLAVAGLQGAGLATNGNAAALMRRAFRHYRIPVTIPKAASRLSSGKKRGLWTDGPEAVAKIRNELVHPENRLRVGIQPYLVETWQLAQWYVELTLLRMAGYTGVYSNRLSARWVGQVEPVPWAGGR